MLNFSNNNSVSSWRSLALGLLMLCLCSLNDSYALTYYTRASGNWSLNTSWSTAGCGGAAAATTPGSTDAVVICAGYTIGVNVNATVASVTIQNGGVLRTGTTLLGANKTLTITGTFAINNGGTYIHNNTQLASSTIFAGTEVFGASSTFQVDDWSSINDMLITGCTSNFGHVNLNWDSGLSWWNNNGLGYTRTIAGTLTVDGSCATYLDNTAGNKTFSIGAVTLNDGWLRIKQTGTGNITVNVTGGISLTNASSLLYGMYGVGGDITINAATITQDNGTFYGIYGGLGNITFNISGLWQHSNGSFNGIYNAVSHLAGIPNYTVGGLTFNGGTFYCNNSFDSLPETMNFTSNGNLNIGYNQPGSIFMFNKVSWMDTAYSHSFLNVVINGDFTINGSYSGLFCSSLSTGLETHVIHGNLNVATGTNVFNGYPDSVWAGRHATNITVDGTTTLSGGILNLSESFGNLYAQFSGPFIQTNGKLTVKRSMGAATVNFNSDWTMSNGEFYLFNYFVSTPPFGDDITVNCYGNFNQSGGLIEYLNMPYSTGPSPNYWIRLLGPSCSLGPLGQILFSATNNNTQALFSYSNAAGMVFSRSGTHNIQGVKQMVSNGVSLDVVGGGIQVSSQANPGYYLFEVGNGATVNLRGFSVFSNNQLPYCGIRLFLSSRIKTSHPDGFYNGTSSAAINANGNMNYFLDSLSTVEYNGTVNQQITGINVGLATGTQHKYGILEINHSGPAGTWAYPTATPSASGNVIVRNKLMLTQGELNLANASGSPAAGGRSVHLTNPSPTSLQTVSGYMRSEAQDHSGRLVWTINNITGLYTIPWGLSLSELMPLTYQLTGGNAGVVSFSTYRTPPDNLPWPSGVTNLASNSGLSPDNRAATVDRFWRMSNTGTNPALTLKFVYSATEVPSIPFSNPTAIRAQAYNSLLNNWKAPLAGQIGAAYQVVVPGAGGEADWTLVSSASPLPVEWLYVKAAPVADFGIDVEWSTASEVNCDYFTLWKLNGGGGEKLSGKIAGHGTTSQVSTYHFEDVHPSNGINYYQVSQTDYDGTTSFSDIVAVSLSHSGHTSCWYDAATNNILIHRSESEKVTVKVVDVSGRLLSAHELEGSRLSIDATAGMSGQLVLLVIENQEGAREVVKVHL